MLEGLSAPPLASSVPQSGYCCSLFHPQASLDSGSSTCLICLSRSHVLKAISKEIFMQELQSKDLGNMCAQPTLTTGMTLV